MLQARLRTTVGSASSRVDDQVDATLLEPVNGSGLELIPAGSAIHGKVVEAVPASPRDLRGRVAVAFFVVQHAATGSRAAIVTRAIVFDAPDAPPKTSRAKAVDRKSGRSTSQTAAVPQHRSPSHLDPSRGVASTSPKECSAPPAVTDRLHCGECPESGARTRSLDAPTRERSMRAVRLLVIAVVLPAWPCAISAQRLTTGKAGAAGRPSCRAIEHPRDPLADRRRREPAETPAVVDRSYPAALLEPATRSQGP